MVQFFHLFQQNREFTYLSIVLAISLIAFLISWLVEPRRLNTQSHAVLPLMIYYGKINLKILMKICFFLKELPPKTTVVKNIKPNSSVTITIFSARDSMPRWQI